MSSYELSGPKWGSSGIYGTSGGVVTWSFATANYVGQSHTFNYLIDDAGQKAAVRQAFARWESVCNIDFVETSDASSVDIRLGFGSIDGVGGTLGNCWTSWSVGSNTYSESLIRFDSAETWTTSVNGSGEYFYSVALHEIGHALGLDHVHDRSQLMYEYTGANDLSAGDIAGARFLYGGSGFAPDPDPQPDPDPVPDTRTTFFGTFDDERYDLSGRHVALEVNGSGGDDLVWGGSAGDTLRGGSGRDVVIGGGGDDVIYGDTSAFALFDSPNQLLGGDGDDRIEGGDDDDYIHGESGDDVLYGGFGNDLIYGGYGADVIHGESGDDILWAGSAKSPQGDWFGDAIQVTRDGVTGASIAQAWSIAGETQRFDRDSDELYGGDGNDILLSNGGGDRLDGGAGIDTASYEEWDFSVVARLNDAARNKGGAKGDTYVSVENLTGSRKADKLVGTDGVNVLSGGRGADTLEGLGGKDVLDGGGGKDILIGGKGSDRLKGGTGNDKLTGGIGADRLEGGDGADRFIFTDIADSTRKKTGRDLILDFSRREGDRIDLSAIDAREDRPGDQAFSFVKRKDFSGTSGELRYDKLGDRTYVYGDVDGDARIDFAIVLEGRINLKATDFVL